jgi:hypothetical protein
VQYSTVHWIVDQLAVALLPCLTLRSFWETLWDDSQSFIETIFSFSAVSNQIKLNQIKSNQIKSNQIKSNQIKSNQIKSNQRNNWVNPILPRKTLIRCEKNLSGPRLLKNPIFFYTARIPLWLWVIWSDARTPNFLGKVKLDNIVVIRHQPCPLGMES